MAPESGKSFPESLRLLERGRALKFPSPGISEAGKAHNAKGLGDSQFPPYQLSASVGVEQSACFELVPQARAI
jgi:hypothetical protein